MGIPDGANRLVFSGDLLGGLESWAFGLWFTGPGFDLAVGEPTTTAYTDFRTAFLNVMRPEDHYTRLDAYKYSGGIAVSHAQATFNRAGTSSVATLPAQCAIAITLRTALATRSGRGRIYVPYRGASVDTVTGRGDTTKINAIVDKLAAYLTQLNSLSPPEVGVVVSQTLSATNPITQVDADPIIDTQRRRRASLTGPRHSATV